MQQANSHSEKQPGISRVVLVVSFLLVVFISFCLSAASADRALKRGDDRLMQLFDSGVYLNSARTVNAVDAENETNKMTRQKELADMLILDGPVLPCLVAKVLLLAKQFQAAELHAVVLLESGIQALLSGLVLIFSLRLTGNLFLALAAGMLWTIYPPAVIATQRLATENLCAAVLLAVLLCFDWTFSAASKKHLHLYSLGLAAIFFGLLLLTKPVLMFAILLPLLFVALCLPGNKALSGLLIFASVTAITMAPFWNFTQQATGKICFLPQRIPTFNALVGNNLLTDGLQGLPQGPVSDDVARNPSVAGIELALFFENPIAHTDLNIRKLPRIFAEPWNDFRRAAILPNAPSIRLAHQLLGAFELAAIVLAFAVTTMSLKNCIENRFKRNSEVQQTIEDERGCKTAQTVSLIFLAISGHLVYLAFEGIPRYGFTAAPLLLILAIWLIKQTIIATGSKAIALNLAIPAILLGLLANFGRLQTVLNWIGSPAIACVLLGAAYFALYAWLMLAVYKVSQSHIKAIGTRMMKVVIAVSILLFTATLALSIIRERINSDLITNLAGPLMAAREVDLSESHFGKTNKNVAWALLLIDSDKRIVQSSISLNGHKIQEPVDSVYQYYQKKYDLLAFLEEMAADIKVKPEDVRQWRAVPIPVEYLKPNGKNTITVSPLSGGELTIYGDYAEHEFNALPTFEHLSHSRMFADASCLDWRPRINFLTHCQSQSSIESNERKYSKPTDFDLGSAPSVQQGRLRLLLAVGLVDKNASLKFTSATKSLPLSSLDFKNANNADQKPAPENKSNDISFDQSCRANYPLNANQQATHVLVELTGKARLLAGMQKQAVVRISLHSPENELGTAIKYGAKASPDSYYDCKGQPKPESICLPGAMQMLTLSSEKATDIKLRAIYPLDVVRYRGDHLTIELMPVPAGTPVRLEQAELRLREIAGPDLGRGTIAVY